MSLKGNTNEEKIWNYLKAKGFNDYGIAGLMGNIYCESCFQSNNLQNNGNTKLGVTDDEFVSLVDSGKYARDTFINDGFGMGLCQWTYKTRKADFYDFVKSKNASIGDLETQLDFLYKELSESYKSVFNVLKTATSILEASNYVLFNFERPADQGISVQNKRAGYGQTYYDKYATKINEKDVNNETLPVSTSALKYKNGDIVDFTGTVHYASSNAVNSSPCKVGVAKVTSTAKGAKHPYHLIREANGGSTVYGWVDENTIKGIHTETINNETKKEEKSMSNSSLVSYTKISPNKTSPRNHAIDCITIHCVVGQCSVQTLGDIFAPTSRQASSNYGVGYDGKIGMYVEEKDRSWCSSSSENDNRAITIEVASDTTEPYAVNDKAYNALIELVADICKRNGIKKLVWSTNKNDRVNHLNGCNMTVHRDYANKSCPGTYLYERHGDIAAKVNAKLGATNTTTPTNPAPTTTTTTDEIYVVKAGDTLSGIASKYGTTYQKLAEYNGIKNPNVITVGQKIKIPVVKTETKPVTPTPTPAPTTQQGTGYTAAKLIAIAQAEIGYKEKATNSNLDDDTANAGSNNWTKFARDLYNAGYYNGNKNGYAWCDVFVDWCFYQLAGKNAKKAQEIECQTGDCGAGCIYSAQYYRNQNRFYTTPEVGDQIFFGKKGDEEHTGIVETVSANQITTIEGNTSNMVARRTYNRNDSYIVGYGRPKFDASATTPVTPTPTPAPTPAPATTEVELKAGTKLTLNGVALYGSSGAATKANTKTGTYYLWDATVINNRVRITNSTANVGKAGQVTGWIAFADAKKAAGTTTAPTTQKTTFTPYLVKVTADVLNIRKGAGTNYAVVGSIKDKGVYTIVEEANGTGATKWGLLKSKAGWISLDYVKRA